MADSDVEKLEIRREMKVYLKESLPSVEVCYSSSDEETSIAPVSSLTKSVETSTTSVKVNKRLPGIKEKWTSDNGGDSSDDGEEDSRSENDGEDGRSEDGEEDGRSQNGADDDRDEEGRYDGRFEEGEEDGGYEESGYDGRSEDGGDDGRFDDIAKTVVGNGDEETAYTSDSGSQGLWGNNEENFGSIGKTLPTFKRRIPTAQVSSFVSINTLTGKQISEDETCFTATECSPILEQNSFSASSQCSNVASTASTVLVTQPRGDRSKKKTNLSTVTSSTLTKSNLVRHLSNSLPQDAFTRTARPSSSKSSYLQEAPASTSKIITRAKKAYDHEEDIGNDLDLFNHKVDPKGRKTKKPKTKR